ncbi:Proteasome subunit beta type-6 [Tilletia horrida]|nr:Proteasome subunit beta type-6 [Tilletia horrida]
MAFLQSEHAAHFGQAAFGPGPAPAAAAAAAAGQPITHRFNPYDSNGGSILAVAGPDFCVIAGDTRQSTGYSIQTRYKPKVHRLTDKAVLAVCGFAADSDTLVLRLRQQIEWYRHAHEKAMPLSAIARLISKTLYGKRFFPYYVYNILGGLDEDGKGAVYSFDPVGSYEREVCRAAGSAQSLLQPFLDSQIMLKNQQSTPGNQLPTPGTLPLPRILNFVMDSFTSATERHIEVGDGLEIFVVRTPPSATDAAVGPTASDGTKATDVDLKALGAQEAVGGDDNQKEGAVVVLRRELKKD